MQSEAGTQQAPVDDGVEGQSWGKSFLKRSDLHLPQLFQHRVMMTSRFVALAGPLLVVLCTMAVLGAVRYKTENSTHHGLVGFADINRVSARQLGIEHLAENSDVGYDGQFYYFVAYRPSIIWTCPHDPATCPTYTPEFRWQRIFYPMTASLLALGQPQLLPFTLILVNVLAILVTTFLVGQMCSEPRASSWLGAAAGLYCGEMLGFLRDLADPYSVMWVVVAIYLLRKRRYLWGAAAVAAALLTREALIFYLPLLSLPLIAQRRWRTLVLSALIGLGPFIAWQVILKALYGPWAIIQGDSQQAQLVPIPFYGLWSLRHTTPDFALMILFVVVPLLLAMYIALTALWQRGPRSLLTDPVPLMVLLYSVLVSLTYWFNWADFWAPTRLAAPAIVLAVLIAAGLRSLTLRGAYGAILALSALSPLFVLLGR